MLALARRLIQRLWPMEEKRGYGRARGRIVHRRPTRYLASGVPDPESYVELSVEEVDNLITNIGRDSMLAAGYSAPDGMKTFRYIALSNDTLTETATSTTLSSEITTNGLARALATFAHTDGTNVTTVAKTFTCVTASQAAQKAALFAAASGGEMNHVLAFTQRTLQVNDQLAITFTITIG